MVRSFLHMIKFILDNTGVAEIRRYDATDIDERRFEIWMTLEQSPESREATKTKEFSTYHTERWGQNISCPVQKKRKNTQWVSATNGIISN